MPGGKNSFIFFLVTLFSRDGGKSWVLGNGVKDEFENIRRRV